MLGNLLDLNVRLALLMKRIYLLILILFVFFSFKSSSQTFNRCHQLYIYIKCYKWIDPRYTVMDLSADYNLSRILSLQGSINNLANKNYFTRRAESYPGPGIIPADARSYFFKVAGEVVRGGKFAQFINLRIMSVREHVIKLTWFDIKVSETC